ncbi:hypothetical protein ACIPWL_16200 [Streptomyces sp. NPDC090023]|uniref:hypothetical protein n=1 Tax=unclassified Streptomyces TaxID=2593676 RepID=UPI0038262720
MTAESWAVSRLRLEQPAPPALTVSPRTEMDRRWAEAVRANPPLFDGKVAARTGLQRDGADGLLVSWTPLTYRFRVLRGSYRAARSNPPVTAPRWTSMRSTT